MVDRPADLPLPYWIEHGPLPPFIPENLWAEKNRASLSGSGEFYLRVRRTFDGHVFACWNRALRWDNKFDRMGDDLDLIARASLDDVVAAAAPRGFVERHHETLAGGVIRAELLISFRDQRPQQPVRAHHCQMKVWLGDTPLIRSALDRRHDVWGDGWIAVPDEDRVLLSLAYKHPGLAADIIARDRDRDREIQHASLDERARSFGLDAKLAEARALAEQIPFD